MVDKKGLSLMMAAGVLCLSQLPAQAEGLKLAAGNLVVTRSVYQGDAGTVAIGQQLPGGTAATVDGSYPYVWTNEAPDPSFGITAPILLDQYTTGGALINSFNLTDAFAAQGVNLATSFSSKSELAIAESAGGALTLMGYLAPVNTVDVSNSNTPNHLDPTNPVGLTYQRAVAQINTDATLQITPVNAYSGNNGRAALLAGGNYYLVGNAGNGSGTEPTSIVSNTGVQMTTPGGSAETTVVGKQQGTAGSKNGFQFGYSVVSNGLAADKSGKDCNFRGMTIFNNTLYVTKGSGSNGINTVYQVGDAGSLPTGATASATAIAILPGFSATLAGATSGTVYHPHGLWFANANTLYVSDEGDGAAYLLADGSSNGKKTRFGGLQKWTFNGSTWKLAYTLQDGLNLGTQYAITNYPSALNPATDGLRNITGTVNGDGTVTIYGVTSTVSASVDQGADPNRLVSISDSLSATTLPAESFTTLASANYGEVLRGVAVTSAATAPIVDISSRVGVTTSALVYNRATKLYTGTLTVVNQSGANLSGTLAVTLNDLASGITLTNATGSFNGFPSIAAAVSLVPGASTALSLKLSNPANLQVNFTPATTLQ